MTPVESAWAAALCCRSCRLGIHTPNIHHAIATIGGHRLMTVIDDTTTTDPPDLDVTAWIFTFGQGYNLRNNYVRVEAGSEGEARLAFVTARRDLGVLDGADHRWSFQYPDNDETHAMLDRYHLHQVQIDTPIHWARCPVEQAGTCDCLTGRGRSEG